MSDKQNPADKATILHVKSWTGLRMHQAIKNDRPSLPKGCCLVDRALAIRAEALVALKTDESLNERLGISYNTWRKLIAGEPLRITLVKRLSNRVEALERVAGMSEG